MDLLEELRRCQSELEAIVVYGPAEWHKVDNWSECRQPFIWERFTVSGRRLTELVREPEWLNLPPQGGAISLRAVFMSKEENLRWRKEQREAARLYKKMVTLKPQEDSRRATQAQYAL